MRELKGIHRGDVTVRDEQFLLKGILNGNLVVEGAASAVELRGIVHGDVTLRGGTMRLSGIVDGEVRNEGGALEVTGIVGKLRSAGGSTVTERGALVGKG